MTPIELVRMIAKHDDSKLSYESSIELKKLAIDALKSLSKNSTLTVTFDPANYKLVPIRATADWVNSMVQDGWDQPTGTVNTVINFAPPLSKLNVTIHTSDITFNPTEGAIPEPIFDQKTKLEVNLLGEYGSSFSKMFDDFFRTLTPTKDRRENRCDNPTSDFAKSLIQKGITLHPMGKTSPEPLANAEKSAWDTQVAGNHYKDMAIQPMEFSMRNNLNALQHTIIKYVTRYPFKNGVEDLKKGRHAIDMLIESESKK